MSNISLRTTRIVNFFLVSLLCILIRVWYLGVVQYDFHFKESLKPQRRSVTQRLERASIRDRFNIPLALNKMQYDVAVCYREIRRIPRVVWKKNKYGGKKRVLARKKHVEKFSCFLAEKLHLDSQEIEDLIYGKACLFPNTTFVLKEEISEELYYQLKAEEKSWPGLLMQRRAKRIYPQGKLACDVVGYMGAIGLKEYLKIAQETKELKTYLEEREIGNPVFLPMGFSNPQEVKDRLHHLQERCYTINDQVGKSGVEASFDELLRGQCGEVLYEIDSRGNTLRKLPGGKLPIPGERLILSLSSELQLEAEKLLAEYEKFQDIRDLATGKERKIPWQRGGAIVVMHPKTGEILALASHPRFNPNDLIPYQTLEKRMEKRCSILQWMESPSYIGEIWDGKRPMQRERFVDQDFFSEEKMLTWEGYLDQILSRKTVLRNYLNKIQTLSDAIQIQKEGLEGSILQEISHPKDRVLVTDLLQMIAPKEYFPPSLLNEIGDQSLSDFRLFCQTAACHLDPLKELCQNTFQKKDFQKWREKHFTEFLKQQRKKEKKYHKYARPYTEYLEKKNRELFEKFWSENSRKILYSFLFNDPSCPYFKEIEILRNKSADPMLDDLKEMLLPLNKKDRLAYLKALRCFEELNHPLQGKYPTLRSKEGIQYENHLASAFYPYTGFGFCRSQAFRQASPMGSIFKLVPAYASLKQEYESGNPSLNPLTIVDDMQWSSKPGSNDQVLGFFTNGEPIKRLYKGGRLPRGYPNRGTVDLLKAIERSSNLYFSLLAGDILASPNVLLDATTEFGMGSPSGIDLPGEFPGLIPSDLMHNKTGLYSFAIGQHSLVVTPLQAAVMFSSIANRGNVLKPQIVKLTAGKQKENSSFSEGFVSFRKPEIRDTIFLPEEIRNRLIAGMYLVTNGERGSARFSMISPSFHNLDAFQAYRNLHAQIVGKTGTAEILYKDTLDAQTRAKLEKHVWFGGISFEDEQLEDPELVVIVYLRFGSAGRQGAPIAARLVQKWREIQSLHCVSSSIK